MGSCIEMSKFSETLLVMNCITNRVLPLYLDILSAAELINVLTTGVPGRIQFLLSLKSELIAHIYGFFYIITLIYSLCLPDLKKNLK